MNQDSQLKQDIQKKAAAKRGKARTQAVESKVQAAMQAIRDEMAANAGIYPSNGGAVSMNEVARRAGINETTLFAPKQAELRKQVKAWVESLKETETVGRGRVQRKLSERVADWKQLYTDTVNQFIVVELELQNARADNEQKAAELHDLQQKYDALLEQLRSGKNNVKALPVTRKPENR